MPVPRPPRPALTRTRAALAGRPNRRTVHQALMDALELMRYQRGRWAPRRDPDPASPVNHPVNNPANYAHAWRALADDLDTVITLLSELRGAALSEQDRLERLNGDSLDRATDTAR